MKQYSFYELSKQSQKNVLDKMSVFMSDMIINDIEFGGLNFVSELNLLLGADIFDNRIDEDCLIKAEKTMPDRNILIKPIPQDKFKNIIINAFNKSSGIIKDILKNAIDNNVFQYYSFINYISINLQKILLPIYKKFSNESLAKDNIEDVLSGNFKIPNIDTTKYWKFNSDGTAIYSGGGPVYIY